MVNIFFKHNDLLFTVDSRGKIKVMASITNSISTGHSTLINRNGQYYWGQIQLWIILFCLNLCLFGQNLPAQKKWWVDTLG